MLDPDLPVVDPHIHLFDVKGTPRPTQRLAQLFGWNDRLLRAAAKKLFPKPMIDFFGEDNKLVNDYLPPHFRSDSRGCGVTDYVHIQAGWKDKEPIDAVGETAWLESLTDPPAAIVGYADLAQGAAIGAVLDAHADASPRFRGIRHMLTWHKAEGVLDFAEDGELSRTPGFRAGYEQLAERGLSFDAWCYHGQLDQLAELAAFRPDVPVVLCHLGTPVGIAGEYCGVGVSEQERARIADEWRDGISAVAENENAYCKISGLLMPALGFGYENSGASPGVSELVDRLGPLVRHAIETFGPQRSMVASNFPVDAVSVDYQTLFEAFVELTAQDGPEAQAAMFKETATEFYRL